MNLFLKRTFGLFALLSTTSLLTGCVIAIGTGKDNPPPPPTVVVTDSADAATMAEINAAAKLSMDNDKTHALGQIAERATLAVPVQVHLVNTAYRSLSFDNNRTHVLSKIIARADFCDATRHAIVSQLGKLSFDNNRQYILQQINERLKTTPAH
ncbi:MAG: hypothetical protein QM813_14095 [Verrucomicrobiota bacterium]